jgi:hypothetical protein
MSDFDDNESMSAQDDASSVLSRVSGESAADFVSDISGVSGMESGFDDEGNFFRRSGEEFNLDDIDNEEDEIVFSAERNDIEKFKMQDGTFKKKDELKDGDIVLLFTHFMANIQKRTNKKVHKVGDKFVQVREDADEEEDGLMFKKPMAKGKGKGNVQFLKKAPRAGVNARKNVEYTDNLVWFELKIPTKVDMRKHAKIAEEDFVNIHGRDIEVEEINEMSVSGEAKKLKGKKEGEYKEFAKTAIGYDFYTVPGFKGETKAELFDRHKQMLTMTKAEKKKFLEDLIDAGGNIPHKGKKGVYGTTHKRIVKDLNIKYTDELPFVVRIKVLVNGERFITFRPYELMVNKNKQGLTDFIKHNIKNIAPIPVFQKSLLRRLGVFPSTEKKFKPNYIQFEKVVSLDMMKEEIANTPLNKCFGLDKIRNLCLSELENQTYLNDALVFDDVYDVEKEVYNRIIKKNGSIENYMYTIAKIIFFTDKRPISTGNKYAKVLKFKIQNDVYNAKHLAEMYIPDFLPELTFNMKLDIESKKKEMSFIINEIKDIEENYIKFYFSLKYPTANLHNIVPLKFPQKLNVIEFVQLYNYKNKTKEPCEIFKEVLGEYK